MNLRCIWAVTWRMVVVLMICALWGLFLYGIQQVLTWLGIFTIVGIAFILAFAVYFAVIWAKDSNKC